MAQLVQLEQTELPVLQAQLVIQLLVQPVQTDKQV